MSPIRHRPEPARHRSPRQGGFGTRSVPFFEFMLYGARSFAGDRSGAPLVYVTRGRSLTLVAGPALGERRVDR